MDAYKLAVKFFVKDASGIGADDFVPVFHSLIQQKKITDHLVIDVADYEHVPNGPGTLLITLEANYSTDREDGKLGLLYVRKLPINGAETFADRLKFVTRAALLVAHELEADPRLAGRFQIDPGAFLFRIYDRLLGPNEPATFEAVKAGLAAFAGSLFGKPASLEYAGKAKSLFEVRVSGGQGLTTQALLAKLR